MMSRGSVRPVILPSSERLPAFEVWRQLRQQHVLRRISPRTIDFLKENLWKRGPAGAPERVVPPNPRMKVRGANIRMNLRRLLWKAENDQQRRELQYVLRHLKVASEKDIPPNNE